MDRQMHNRSGVARHQIQLKTGHPLEVHVSLPVSYGKGEQSYPVLYVLDSSIMFGFASDWVKTASAGRFMYPDHNLKMPPMPPEMIVVGIGYKGEDPLDMWLAMGKRRLYDYSLPFGEHGIPKDHTLNKIFPGGIEVGGALDFYAALKDTVVPLIEGTYRTRGERTLYGTSAAGFFAAYCLLTPGSPFSQYIIGSPATSLSGEKLFELEAAYASAHKDLQAKVYVSYGDLEWTEAPFTAIASGTARLVEQLLLRGYPGLSLKANVFKDYNHPQACVSALIDGTFHFCE